MNTHTSHTDIALVRSYNWLLCLAFVY